MNSDLFTAIGSTPSTTAEIATRCQCPERGVRILSDYLTILGFLIKDGSRYQLTLDSATFLDRNSPAYLGRSVDFFLVPGIAGAFDDLASTTTDLGAKYDVVLVPNFLPHFNAADCTGILRRIHAALRPGGRVVIVEFVPNEDRVTPAAVAGFALVMLGTTPEGDAYTFADYRATLSNAGFHSAALHPLPPTAESTVIATK